MARRQRERIEPALGRPGGDLRLSDDDRTLPSGRRAAREEPFIDEGIEEDEMAAPRRRRSEGRGRATRKTGGRRRSRRSGGFSLFGIIRRLFYWGMVAGVWGGIAAVCLVVYYGARLPPTSDWAIPTRPPNVEILDRSGVIIGNRGDTGGEAVRLEQLPSYLPAAVIAIEDRRFYSHLGVDPIGVARAMAENLFAGSVVQGGSTLTQQLAKNLFLEPDQTIERKVQEALLALWLEWKYSKEEILEMYLNRVYFGGGAYGVDGASWRFFGHSAREATLAESAILAGVLRAPSRLAPSRDPEAASARGNVVLAAMVDEGVISSADAAAARENPAAIIENHATAAANYAADWVMELLPGYIASVEGDIVVETTIDARMQQAAEAAIRSTLDEMGGELNASQGALVALDGVGAVRALVGGRSYAESQFNRATQARRQPGSSFKPFVYLAALEQGYSPEAIRIDEPITIGNWAPGNYTNEYAGPVTLTEALARSLNTVAAQLAHEVGPATVARTARRLGIVSQLHENPSIALGTGEVTPIEITAAYVPFQNGGYGAIPYIIERISSNDGTVLFERSGEGPGRVVEPVPLGLLDGMLQTAVETGTGARAAIPGRPVGGKTGTTQDYRDAWFIGFTAQLTASVWFGNDDNSPMARVTGGGMPAIAWQRFMAEATRDDPVLPLPAAPYVPVFEPPPVMVSGETPYSGPSPEERGLLETLFGL
jgi:penicillin-binding protein 1A